MDNGLVLDTATGEITFAESLNPYCSGQWSRTYSPQRHVCSSDSLNPYCSGQWSRTIITISSSARNSGLNPYCSGQWSRTRPYKTLLIINKLKSFTKQIFTFLNRKLTIS